MVTTSTQVSIAEYLQTGRTFAEMQVSLRAMIDHFNHTTLVGMWQAEEIRRQLVAGACPRQEAAHTLASVMGFAPDSVVTAQLCTLALQLLMQQPVPNTT